MDTLVAPSSSSESDSSDECNSSAEDNDPNQLLTYNNTANHRAAPARSSVSYSKLFISQAHSAAIALASLELPIYSDFGYFGCVCGNFCNTLVFCLVISLNVEHTLKYGCFYTLVLCL